MDELPKRLADAALEKAEKRADAALKSGLSGWWAQLDENQKYAVAGITAAVTVGPLGMGVLAALGVLFGGGSIPSVRQVAAVFWLFVITAPVVAWILVMMLGLGKGAIGAVLALASGAAYFGGLLMAQVVNPKIGDFYCYASIESGAAKYEENCRAFDVEGFTSQTYDVAGSPSGSLEVFGWALVYTEDARGSLMVFAAAVAAVCVGYLIRRELESA